MNTLKRARQNPKSKAGWVVFYPADPTGMVAPVKRPHTLDPSDYKARRRASRNHTRMEARELQDRTGIMSFPKPSRRGAHRGQAVK